MAVAALGAIVTAIWLARNPPPVVAAQPTTTTAPNESVPTDFGPTTLVKRGTLDLSLDFDGVFEPVDPFELRLKIRAYHDDFTIIKSAAEGGAVSKGDILLQLAPDKIDRAIAAAENDLEIAQANLAKAESDVALGERADELAMSGQKNALADAKVNLSRWDAVDGLMFALSGELNSKVADFYIESATDELDQLRKMYKSEDLTNETADIVMKRAIRMLDLQTLAGRITHALTDRMEQIEAAIQRRELDIAIRQETLAIDQLDAAQTQGRTIRQTSVITLRATMEDARRKVDDLQTDRAMFSIVSPIDGIVVYGSFNHHAWHEIDAGKMAVGEKVQPDEVLMTVCSPGKLQVTAEFPESQVTFLSPGVKVTITPTARQDLSYAGICRSVAIVGESKGSQQVFNADFDLPAVDPAIAPGFTANVNLDAGKMNDVLLVPSSAVWHGKVWVVKSIPTGAKAIEPEVRMVTVGRSDGSQTEIKSGLTEGESILTQAKRPAE
jgi:HlyD family secretion protein